MRLRESTTRRPPHGGVSYTCVQASRVAGFNYTNLTSTAAEPMDYEEPVMTVPAAVMPPRLRWLALERVSRASG